MTVISSATVLCFVKTGILRATGALIRELPQQDLSSPRMTIKKLIVLVAVFQGAGPGAIRMAC